MIHTTHNHEKCVLFFSKKNSRKVEALYLQNQLSRPGTKGTVARLEPKAVHSNDFEVTQLAIHKKFPLVAAGTSDGIVTVYFTPSLFGAGQLSDFREVKAGLMSQSEEHKTAPEVLFASAVDPSLIAGIGSSRVKRVVKSGDKVKSADVGNDPENSIASVAFHPFLSALVAADVKGNVVAWRIGVDDDGHTVIGCRTDVSRTLGDRQEHMHLKQVWFSGKTTELYALFTPKNGCGLEASSEYAYWSTTPGRRPPYPHHHDVGVWSAASKATRNTKQGLPDEPNRLSLSPTPGVQLGMDTAHGEGYKRTTRLCPVLRAFSLAHRSMPHRKGRFSSSIDSHFQQCMRHVSFWTASRRGLRMDHSLQLEPADAINSSDWSMWIRRRWDSLNELSSDTMEAYLKHTAWEENLLPSSPESSKEGNASILSNLFVLGEPQPSHGCENCFLVVLGDRLVKLEDTRYSLFGERSLTKHRKLREQGYPAATNRCTLGHTTLLSPDGHPSEEYRANFNEEDILYIQQTQTIIPSPPRLTIRYSLLRQKLYPQGVHIQATKTAEAASSEARTEDISANDLCVPEYQYLCGLPSIGPYGPMKPIAMRDSPSGRFAVVQMEYDLLVPKGPSDLPVYAFYVIGPLFDYVNQSAAEFPSLRPRCSRLILRDKVHWVLGRTKNVKVEGPYHARNVVPLTGDRILVVDAMEKQWSSMASRFVLSELKHVIKLETENRVPSVSENSSGTIEGGSTNTRRSLKGWINEQEKELAGSQDPSAGYCRVSLLQLSLQRDHNVCQVYGSEYDAETRQLPPLNLLTSDISIAHKSDLILCQAFSTPLMSSCGDILLWFTKKWDESHQLESQSYLEYSVNASLRLDVDTRLPCTTQILALLPPLGYYMASMIDSKGAPRGNEQRPQDFDPFVESTSEIPNSSSEDVIGVLLNAHDQPLYSYMLNGGENALDVIPICSSVHLQLWLDSMLQLSPNCKKKDDEFFPSVRVIGALGILPFTVQTDQRIIPFTSDLKPTSPISGVVPADDAGTAPSRQTYLPEHYATVKARDCNSGCRPCRVIRSCTQRLQERVCSIGYAQGLPIVATTSGVIHAMNVLPRSPDSALKPMLKLSSLATVPSDIACPTICMQQGQILSFAGSSFLSVEPEETHVYTRPINFDELALLFSLRLLFGCEQTGVFKDLCTRQFMATLHAIVKAKQKKYARTSKSPPNLQSDWGYSRSTILFLEFFNLRNVIEYLFGARLLDETGKALSVFDSEKFRDAFGKAQATSQEEDEEGAMETSGLRGDNVTMSFSSEENVDALANTVLTENGHPRLRHLVPPWWAGDLCLYGQSESAHFVGSCLNLARHRPALYGYLKCVIQSPDSSVSPGTPNPIPDPLDSIVNSFRKLTSFGKRELKLESNSPHPWLSVLAYVPHATASWITDLLCQSDSEKNRERANQVLRKYFNQISKYDPSAARALSEWMKHVYKDDDAPKTSDKMLNRMVFSHSLQPKSLPPIDVGSSLSDLTLLQAIRTDLSLPANLDMAEAELQQFMFSFEKGPQCFNTVRSCYGTRVPQLWETVRKKHTLTASTGIDATAEADEVSQWMQELGIGATAPDESPTENHEAEETTAKSSGLPSLGLKEEDKVVGYWRFEARADRVNNSFNDRAEEPRGELKEKLEDVYVHDLSGKANPGFLILNKGSSFSGVCVDCGLEFGEEGNARDARALRLSLQKQEAAPDDYFGQLTHPFIDYLKEHNPAVCKQVPAGAAVPVHGMSYVNVGLCPFAKVNSKFTLEFWFKWGPPLSPEDCDDETSKEDQQWKLESSTLVSRFDLASSETTKGHWSLRITQGGAISFVNEISSRQQQTIEKVETAEGIVEEQQWCHIAVVIDGDGAFRESQGATRETITALSSKASVKLFVNGEQSSEGKVSCYYPAKGVEGAVAGYMVFGGQCVGDLTEIRLWATERSETDLYDRQGFCLDIADDSKKRGISINIKSSTKKTQNGDEGGESRQKSHSSPSRKLPSAPRPGALKPPRRASHVPPRRKISSIKKPETMPTIQDEGDNTDQGG
eukprot:gb/GECG01003335.1/.p1 GENE.gb/GECG01003335.1/~~gb/GECG01003335.1/.p1  ORF type:complete len:2043 (+),score=249.53 gb/GECG01003335.1/:1-6129(+)